MKAIYEINLSDLTRRGGKRVYFGESKWSGMKWGNYDSSEWIIFNKLFLQSDGTCWNLQNGEFAVEIQNKEVILDKMFVEFSGIFIAAGYFY